MRLICPSCGAQYEVDESVIPDKGRDVQCSNCGNAWFQQSAAQIREAAEDKSEQKEAVDTSHAAPADPKDEWVAFDLEEDTDDLPGKAGHTAAVSEDDVAPEEVDGSDTQDGDDDHIEDADEQEDATAVEPSEHEAVDEAASTDNADESSDDDVVESDAGADPGTEDTQSEHADDDDADAALAAAEATPPTEAERVAGEGFRRRTLDDAVRNVLREEAERENRARRDEGSDFQNQTDFALGAAVAAATQAASGDDEPAEDRIASIRGTDADLDDDVAASRPPRRELLPDIEEINSTLTATSDRGEDAAARDAPETLRRRRSGFRRGFSTAIIVLAVLLGVYILAPRIASSVPAVEPILARYVMAVDSAREWLDTKLQALTLSLKGDGG